MSVSTQPAPAGTDPRVERLRQALRREAATTRRPAGPPPITATRGGPAPLSFGQRRLWFLHQVQPDSTMYAVPFVLRLTGPLDLFALRLSLDDLVARHESLRTRYRIGPDGPYQEIGPVVPMHLPVVDLSSAGAPGPDAPLPQPVQRHLARHLAKPFDLTAGRLCHALLIRLGPEDHVLALSVHHIACDGWSLGLLLRDLGTCYPAWASGRTPKPPPAAVRYADFARWQREHLSGAVLDRHLEYWRTRLAGVEPLELHPDRPRAADWDARGAAVTFEIPADVGQAVLELGRGRRATPFMTLLAALFVVLGRHTRQAAPVIGTPVAGRERAEIAETVGFFVNTMVCRGDLSGDPTFADLLDRVRDGSVADYAHQDLPFERLVEELAPDRDLARTPLVPAMLVVEPSTAPVRLGELTAREVRPPSCTAKLDLTVAVELRPDGAMDGVIEYPTALFDEARIVRLAGHLRHLLAQVAARPTARLSELDLVHGEERDLLVRAWNDTARGYPEDGRCLHELIAEQARRTPGATAVRCGGAELRYAELDRRANQLAHRLRELGVAPETPVGVLLDRDLHLLPALLGILKAGGHYVPLDLAYPPDRLAFMLAETGAAVLVTTSAHDDRLPPFTGPVLHVDDPGALARYPTGPVPVRVHPDNLAYIIYTSGSTGRPKGVMIPHRGVVHYLAWCRQAYHADDGDGAPVHSSLSFDLTVTGLFLPLLCGTTVTLIPDDEHPVAGLAAALDSGTRFSFVKLTPAHLEPLQRCLTDPARGARAAHHLVVGGEQLTAEALAFWREHAPDVVVANEYGHTETSVANVMNLLPAGDAVHTPVAVGRPIWNTTVYLVDEHLRPVPVGVTGELLAGGVGVARGFAGRPGLTADRYLPNPFGPGRVYRSGDLARYLPDGTLEFVGRTDDQVKIRGYRIELGEIEAGLLSHPEVAECAVVVRPDAHGVPALAGYVVPAGRGRPDPRSLREHLAARLPAYQVPTMLAVLDELPLTPNGKVDRAALPAITAAAAPTRDRTPARDRHELAVRRVWEEVLGQAPIGVTDDFFELGGHSILAVSVVERLRTELGLDVGLSALFRARTVRALCAGAGTGSGGGSCVLPMRPGTASHAPLILVPPTAGNPFPYLPLVDLLDPDRPVYGLQAVGYDSEEPPLSSIEQIAARYLAELDELGLAAAPYLVGWSFGGSVAYEMAAQLEAAGRPVGHLCLIDASVLGTDRIEAPAEVTEGDALGLFGRTVLELAPDRLSGLSPEQAAAELLAQARERDLVSAVAHTGVIERMAEVYLANSRATAAYRAGTVLRTGIHLIRSTERHPEHGGPQVRAESWRALTAGGLRVTELAGNHWSIVEPPHVAALARALTTGLPGRPTADGDGQRR